METHVVCEECGEKASINFSFCRKCGTDLSSVGEAAQSLQETTLPPNPSE